MNDSQLLVLSSICLHYFLLITRIAVRLCVCVCFWVKRCSCVTCAYWPSFQFGNMKLGSNVKLEYFVSYWFFYFLFFIFLWLGLIGKLMASKLHQLQSKAVQASQFVSKHGGAYYKQLLEQNKQFIQEPPTVEKCNLLSKQLFYTRLARL